MFRILQFSVQFEACKFEKWIIIYPAAVREYKDF